MRIGDYQTVEIENNLRAASGTPGGEMPAWIGVLSCLCILLMKLMLALKPARIII